MAHWLNGQVTGGTLASWLAGWMNGWMDVGGSVAVWLNEFL